MKNKIRTILFLLCGDIGMSVYTYLSLTNFNEFKKLLLVATRIDSPEYQIEIYKVFLQTLTTITISVVFIHIIIYLFYYRGKKFAVSYVKFYAILACGSLLVSALFMNQFLLLIPTIIYGLGVYYSRIAE